MKPDKNKPTSSKKQPAGRVFDVRRPGKALATPASRPVIIGHKPEAQQAQAAVSGVGETRPLLPRRKIQIMPSGDIEVENTKTEQPPAESAQPPAAPEPQKPAAPAEATEKDKEALAAAAIDAVAGPPELPSGEGKDMLLNKSKITIKPVSDEAAQEETPEDKPEEPAKAEEPAEPKPEPAPEPVQPSEPEAKPEPAAVPEVSAKPVEPEAIEGEIPKDTSSVPETEAAEVVAGGPATEATQEEQPPEPKIEPLFDDSGKIVVSHHNHRKHHGLRATVLVLVILLLAAVIFDLLLDLEVLNLPSIPHTDLL